MRDLTRLSTNLPPAQQAIRAKCFHPSGAFIAFPQEELEQSLDDHGQQVDCQSVGEIAVRSRYLSPGYWRRPALTQAKFLFDSQSEDVRTYLTGDVGRLLPDGCLMHLGRKDLQVKIRGYRVDIAEIEQALLALDPTTEAVVVARENRPAELSLVAYVVTSQQPSQLPCQPI